MDFALGRQREEKRGIYADVIQFAATFNAAHFKNLFENGLISAAEKAGRGGDFEALFPRFINQIIGGGGRIRFNLDQVSPRNAFASHAPITSDYTEWELRQIVRCKQWLRNTVFYRNGIRLRKYELRQMGIKQ